jgi:hypothetical protein
MDGTVIINVNMNRFILELYFYDAKEIKTDWQLLSVVCRIYNVCSRVGDEY